MPLANLNAVDLALDPPLRKSRSVLFVDFVVSCLESWISFHNTLLRNNPLLYWIFVILHLKVILNEQKSFFAHCKITKCLQIKRKIIQHIQIIQTAFFHFPVQESEIHHPLFPFTDGLGRSAPAVLRGSRQMTWSEGHGARCFT